MRVLLEQEYEAVAGGHVSDCEQTVKTILIASGVLGGALGGGGIPGAIAGGALGALVAEATGHYICSMGEEQEEEEQDGTDDPELDALFMQQYVKWLQNLGFGNSFGPKTTGPHQLVVDQSY